MADWQKIPATKLLWIDLEMTGLDPSKDRILEVAAIVTDFNFQELDLYESVIYQPPKIIAQMNEWVKDMTTTNGLINRIKTAPKEQQVVKEFVDFIKRNFEEPVVLAGNSVHQDRRFIKQWWPEVEAKLHYRMMDVSSFKIIMQGKYNKVYKKKEVHLAKSDILESINELKFYLDYLKRHQ